MKASSLSKAKQVQFANIQNSVGINMQNFFNKFVFHQNSDPQAFYIDTSAILPSQHQNMTVEQINICIFMMSQIIFKVGQCLKLPVSTSIVAVSISQYFYTRKSFVDQDFREVAMGAMFLACKSEETLRRSYQVASCFHYIFKLFEGSSTNGRSLFSNQEQYNFIKNKVLKIESEILFDLGFQIYKLFDIPTRYISGLLAFFNKDSRSLQIVQTSWTYLNDIYKTRACLYFPGQFLAAAAVYLSLVKLKVPFSTCPWWILMQSNLKYIQYICFLVEQMKDIIGSGKVRFSQISIMLQNIGFNKCGIANVFPVPYFRKIKMQLAGTYKLKQKIEIQKTINNSIVNKQHLSHSLQNDQTYHMKDKQKIENKKPFSLNQNKLQTNTNKKQKHKSKNKHKKHKQKRNISRSNDERKKNRSSSSSQNKQLSEQDTPKVTNIKNKQCQSKNQAQQFSIFSLIDQKKKQQQMEQIQAIKVNIAENQKNNFATKELQVKNSKDLLSKINLQLKKHEIKKQTIIQKNEAQFQKINIQEQNAIKNQQEDLIQMKNKEIIDSEQDEQLLAQLIQIKKQNKQSNTMFKTQQSKQ